MDDEMEVRTWTKIQELDEKKCSVACSNCDAKTQHRILSNIQRFYDGPDFFIEERYQTIQCCGCESFSFRKVTYDRDSLALDNCSNPIWSPTGMILYPPRSIGKLRFKYDELNLLPLKIRKLFEEVYSAIANECKVLAVAGIRVLLEAICKEKQAAGNQLRERIDSLAHLDLITLNQSEILHKIRDCGNDAAHEVEFFDEETIHAAFMVIQHLLQSLYVIKHRADKIGRKSRAVGS